MNRVKLNKTHRLLSPVKGRFLLAEPFAVDLYFSRSVVLLMDAGPGGCMGLVLNKRVNRDIAPFLSKFGLADMPVFRGGPVEQERLFYVHDVPDVQGAVQIGVDLYVGGSLREVVECYKASSRAYHLKFFLGYAGWTGGQLEDEIERESWVVCEQGMDIWGDGGEMWQEALLALDDLYYNMWLNCPFDPQFN